MRRVCLVYDSPQELGGTQFFAVVIFLSTGKKIRFHGVTGVSQRPHVTDESGALDEMGLSALWHV